MKILLNHYFTQLKPGMKITYGWDNKAKLTISEVSAVSRHKTVDRDYIFVSFEEKVISWTVFDNDQFSVIYELPDIVDKETSVSFLDFLITHNIDWLPEGSVADIAYSEYPMPSPVSFKALDNAMNEASKFIDVFEYLIKSRNS